MMTCKCGHIKHDGACFFAYNCDCLVYKEDMNEFKVGDTVKLKSGGPLMTVTRITEAHVYLYHKSTPKTCRCMWFDDNNTVRFSEFPMEALRG